MQLKESILNFKKKYYYKSTETVMFYYTINTRVSSIVIAVISNKHRICSCGANQRAALMKYVQLEGEILLEGGVHLGTRANWRKYGNLYNYNYNYCKIVSNFNFAMKPSNLMVIFTKNYLKKVQKNRGLLRMVKLQVCELAHNEPNAVVYLRIFRSLLCHFLLDQL